MKHFSLCSGIGGLDLAAEWAGFETVAQCEIDEYAGKVLAKNFKGVPNLHDIRTVTNRRLKEFGIDPAEIDLISAGFPCQPYSLAGKGRGDGDERDLWGEVARVLGEIKPRWFVGENTPGLFARQNQRYFKRVLDDLTALGYRVGWGIWGACDVGAPHRRDRVFIVGRYSNGVRKQEKREIQERQDSESCGTCGKISYTDGDAERRLSFGTEKAYSVFGKLCDTIPYSDGLWKLQPQGSDQNKWKRSCDGCWWETEPDVGRVAHGVPARVDRLRCLGNAVVPQQAYPIFEAIAKYEEQKGEIS